jgi:hypothetical protein
MDHSPRDYMKRVRLKSRLRLLTQKYRRNVSAFRVDPKLQTEMRRVAALCIKLEMHLPSHFQDEIARGIHES